MFKRKNDYETPAFGDAHFALTPEMKRVRLLGPKGIRLGYYREPGVRKGWGEVIRYAGDAGLILISPARSGKTRDFLAAAVMENEHSAVIVDPRGQIAAITKKHLERKGHRTVVLNPYDVFADLLGKSASYNMLALLDPSSLDFDAACRKLAEALIARSDAKDASHWISGARGLLAGIIGALVAHGSEETKNLPYVREVICDDVLLLRYARASRNSPHAFIRHELASYAVAEPHNPAEIAGFKQTAREQTSFLSMEAIAKSMVDSDFCFSPLKDGDEPTTVYIILPDNKLDTCGPWFRLIVASALDELWQGGRGKYRILMIIDEFARIGHLDVLESAAAAAAGRGVQLWPVLQNIGQLRKDYGESFETFLSGADMQIFMAPREAGSAEYISKWVGQRTVSTASQSVQNAGPLGSNKESDTSGQAGQPLIRPHELATMGDNEALIIGPHHTVINALRQPYFDTPELKSMYDPDPLHKNDAAPRPPVDPDSIVTFADTLAAGKERAERERRARRPTALRLLTWGKSRNPYLNIALKVEYFVTLPARIVLAALLAPFHLHSRPFGLLLGFLALFGFWEIWNGLVKKPITDLYELKVTEFMREASLADPNSTGDVINSRYKALKWLVSTPFNALRGSPAEGEPVGKRTVQTSSRGALQRLDDKVASFSENMDRQFGDSLAATPLISPEEQHKIVAREMADLLRNVPSIEPDSNASTGQAPAEPPPFRFARPATICHMGALFAPLPSQGPSAEAFIDGLNGTDLKKRLREFVARPLALGTPVRPLLNSSDDIVRPADDVVLASVNGEIGVVFEHDLLFPQSPPR